MTELAGRSVLITGAGSGIGRLIAEKVASRGAKLVLWDIDETALGTARAMLESRGHEVVALRCDLSDAGSIREAAKRTLIECERVDVLINNAGIVSGRTLLEVTDEQIVRTFAVNTLALFRTTRAFLPGMIERGVGHVVTIASAGGLIGTAKLTDYCSSKFAAVGFDESLRLELARLAAPVRTTVVCPFYISTGMFEGVRTRFPWLLPILTPDYAASRIVRAIEKDRARLIMPRFVYSSWLVRLLPVPLFDALMDFFGVSKSMDEFVGRR